MKTILKAENLYKSYKINRDIEQRVLKNINIKVSKEEFISLMGPSGSGKSTLLYSLSGMDKITSGKIIFNEEDISDFSETKLAGLRLNRMGFIFQQTHFLNNLNIFDNIILPGYLAKNEAKEKINERAETLMKKMRILDISKKDISQISGGQLQRAGICRALINNPEIIFGDEPTGALNSKYTNEIMDILGDINLMKKTILLVTHDTRVSARAERILFMFDGKIISELFLGKYNKENGNILVREEKLNKWLKEMDF